MRSHKITAVVLTALLAMTASAQQSVETTRVVSKTVERKLSLPGEFMPYLAVNLYSRVNGFVDKVSVDRGSIVKEGELLITIVAPELAAQLGEAESKVRAVESQRAEAEAKFVASRSTYERLKAASATRAQWPQTR